MSAAGPRVELVAAVAANGVIGRDGGLPWHLPDDLRHFRALTWGHVVVMGRRTFESIGRALPGRRCVVVSRSLREAPQGVELARSLEEALRKAGAAEVVYVIGGAALYAAALPLASRLHLTELDEAVEGDTYFPAFDRAAWRVVIERRHERDERQANAFTLRTYERIG